MRVQLAQQAKEILGQSDLVSITERVDDVALLIGQMVKMGLPEVLDRPIPRHGTQRGLSWGWTAVMWLASIVTEGDHRTGSVATSRKGMHHTLSHLTAQAIEPLDLSDARWSQLRKPLRKPAYWHTIERALHERSMEMYDWSQDVIRCEATTVSGAHELTAEGRRQCGPSQADPARPQSKVMLGALAPLGMPRATDV
jgi:transposase